MGTGRISRKIRAHRGLHWTELSAASITGAEKPQSTPRIYMSQTHETDSTAAILVFSFFLVAMGLRYLDIVYGFIGIVGVVVGLLPNRFFTGR
ncbi:hypothetical protein AA14337_3193 [Acetobacter malorum DSM 14337]|uniref:Uncharacterized protein n=1 Tax=Acetobacter malorum DSM 14337 TaxID=1307910 RepID=A0ABQ0Q084_9PROT|nr:hypothetical protein AA14337_3193 [Acetobacter malorum DSM 14337]